MAETWQEIIALTTTDNTTTVAGFNESPALTQSFPAPAQLIGEPQILNQASSIDHGTNTITISYLVIQYYRAAGSMVQYFSIDNGTKDVIPPTTICSQIDSADFTFTVTADINSNLVRFNFSDVTVNYKECTSKVLKVWTEQE
jgi:hypothetical protein